MSVMNFYIADTHFGHKNVIQFDNRPFKNIDEMDRTIIANWNAVVGQDDDVYIIGDFCYRSDKGPLWYLKKLNGRKHLIRGNHDNYLLKDEEVMKEFVSVDKMAHIKDGQYTILMCHFPIAEWNQYNRGAWHIYGHIHNSKQGCYKFLKNEERALNAGCMINNYIPVAIEQLIENNIAFRNNDDYLWDLYGDNNVPVQTDVGLWLFPSQSEINGNVYMESGNIDYIFSEYCKTGLHYTFYTHGQKNHGHTFSDVLYQAYQNKDTFEIKDEDKHEYSEQELNFLEVLIEKLKNDG